MNDHSRGFSMTSTGLLTRATLRLWTGGHLNKTTFLFCQKAGRNGYQASNNTCSIGPNPICADTEIYLLVYCMKIVVQLHFKKKADVLTERKHRSSMYNYRSILQGLLFRAFTFQPKWRKFVGEYVAPPL